MNLPIRQILSSLRHHRLTAGLLALQVALTCAIVANALFLIAGRVDRMRTPSGLPEDEISLISVRGLHADGNARAQQETDLAALRAIPGVVAAAAVGSTLPLSGGAYDSAECVSRQELDAAIGARSLENRAGCVTSTAYYGSPGLLQALGARLIAGRDFRTEEFTTQSPSTVIVTRALAHRLWPHENPLGKAMYGNDVLTVIGVVDDVLRPKLRDGIGDNLVKLLPMRPVETSTRYLLRSAPQERMRILESATAALAEAGPVRLIPIKQRQTFEQVRQAYFQRDSTMIGLLLAATFGLLFVAALGIGGLANFWVAQRTRQIGVRRALGATRGDILRHFQIENFLIVGGGMVPGLVLTVALNQWLMASYELPRLPWYYLPVGAAALWGLGQLSVLGPALRAAAVPPAVATRTA